MQNLELRKEAADGIAAGGEGGLDGGERAAVPGRAERLGAAAGGHGGDDIGVGLPRGFEEAAEERRGEFRHVAGEDEAPAAATVSKGGFDAAEGSAAGIEFGEAGEAEVRVAFGGADEGDAAGGFPSLGGDPLNEGGAAVRQQGFVAAHAGALAAGEYERRCRHETILTAAEGNQGFRMRDIAVSGPGRRGYNQKNKSMRICLTGMALLAAAAGMAPAGAAERVSTTVRADVRTGRLVRSTVAAPVQATLKPMPAREVSGKAGQAEARTTDFDGIVEEAARSQSVDPLLVHSVIRVESNYNPVAVSPKGAAGLMQLIPETARRFGASNRFNVRENIMAGVKYLKYLQEMFKDNRLALAAYNAGEGAVQRYKDIPPYRETADYVQKVGTRYGEARRKQQKKESAAKAAEVAAAGPKPEPLRQLEVATDAEGRVILRTR